MADKIQIRRDTAAAWTSANPVLYVGEMGLETNTKKFKVGDGVTAWNALAYWGDAYDGNPATINQDATHRFATDQEKSTWDSKVDDDDPRLSDARPPTAHNHDSSYEPKNTNIQTHIGTTHAPADAQKNSDITKGEIEAKLTGEITTHTHAVGTPIGYAINVQALTSSPADGATIYFGTLPKAPVTTAGTSKIYIRKAGTIKIAEIYCYSGTAGSAENWSINIRKNNSTDTLIATVGASTSERVFSNTTLNIAVVAGDYIEIKCVNPTWATNPLTTIFGGYIYIE